jgi:hypothetical protein
MTLLLSAKRTASKGRIEKPFKQLSADLKLRFEKALGNRSVIRRPLWMVCRTSFLRSFPMNRKVRNDCSRTNQAVGY